MGGWSTLRPGRFTSGNDPVPIVRIGGWEGARDGLDECGKSRPVRSQDRPVSELIITI